MKSKTALYLLIIFSLTACTSNIEVIPTIISTATITREPTATPEPIVTPTREATPVSTKLEVLNTIPVEMEEFYELGLDKQEFDGKSMKVVLLEDSIQFGEPFSVHEWPGVEFSGIKWKDKIILSWVEVLFTLDKQVVKGKVVNSWYDTTNKILYILEGSGVNTLPTSPSKGFVEKTTKQIQDLSENNNPIVILEFGSTNNELTDSVFEGAFPLEPFAGEDDQLVFIPSVGWVIPVTHIDIREAMVVPTPEE